ncbi:MAG: GNAT family N-acetyltransferase [Deltaproteobacteria bacterium]|nr:GNAT family N-acetyltransferase [Deltaproteobacteria bacterium]
MHPTPGFDGASRAGAWRELQALPRTGAPILAPQFFALTERVFGTGPSWLVGARAGDTRAVLPLVREGRELVALRSEHSPRFDMIGEASGLPALWAELVADKSWRILRLDGVSEDSPLVRALPELARRDGCRTVVQPTSRAPYFVLDGFEERLDKEFRRQLRKRAKRIPELSFERITTYDAEAVQDFFRLESSGWKEGEGTSIASSPVVSRFYDELVAEFASAGQLSLCFMRSGSQRIAVQLALEDDHTCYLLKTGYDPEYRQHGAGHLVIYHYALDARERGRAVIDLCGTESDAKRCWTDLARQRMQVRVYRGGALGTLEYAARHIVRPQLGRIRRALAR